ncbi:MAG: metal ABC transporter ATP-binding protein [Ignisphaera sp.]|nr:metal ABC transporter ATP-binding protein [Ignisphaera sp.]MCX8167494.1 metal ABC transporter ATP-binding protein [Ignisphaera sp.]MDW8084642.1 metal ABC transporter ATP-binding protein [Ignisphaera sp.]
MEIVALKVVDLAIGYEKPLIRNINVELESPYILLIIGPNGVGKTTFLKTLIGFVRPHAGKVYVNQIDITGNSELAGVFMDYVPQLSRFTSTTGFPITVWEFVEFGLTIHLKKMGLRMDKSEMQRIIKETFNTVGIDKSLWDRSIWKLSGGEMQRLFMARALVNNQPIILLDEPLSSIDPEGKMEIIDVISILKKDKIILITCHDPEIFLGICDNVMIFGRGVYYIGKPMEVLNIDVLGRIYGKSVIKFKDHVHIYDHHN